MKNSGNENIPDQFFFCIIIWRKEAWPKHFGIPLLPQRALICIPFRILREKIRNYPSPVKCSLCGFVCVIYYSFVTYNTPIPITRQEQSGTIYSALATASRKKGSESWLWDYCYSLWHCFYNVTTWFKVIYWENQSHHNSFTRFDG